MNKNVLKDEKKTNPKEARSEEKNLNLQKKYRRNSNL